MVTPDYYPDMPLRWGIKLAALFAKEGYKKHAHKHEIVYRAQSGFYPLPLDATDEAIVCAADRMARECYGYCEKYRMAGMIVEAINALCDKMGISHPVGESGAEIIARGTCKNWWARQLRKWHARRFEHASIQLGFTSYHAGPYLCDESALRQAKRNRENAKFLENQKVQNEHGQTYTLAELAALGVANKTIRRGELMTRIRGFEEVASDMKHVAMFWTITAPSKYHGVIQETGATNPKYVAFGSPTPRDAQAYLCDVWKCIRSALHRRGIRPYGLRIAEPHHDGCPHWHMLLFVAQDRAEEMESIVRKYALQEDGDEVGAQKNRVKLVRIEVGKGTATGYCVKYVCKNVDGEGVGDHKTLDGYTVVPDMFGNEEITPSQRVTYWSQLHGIRQFQQIGGAPVGVWRELRRIKEETVRTAHKDLWAAWLSVQKIDGGPEIAKQASYADFMRAMGGPCVGRKGKVQLAKRLSTVEGKYATYEEGKPCGVFHHSNKNAVYESVRYQWFRVDAEGPVASPRTGVNNCTRTSPKWLKEASGSNSEILKNQKICSANECVRWDEERTELKPDAENLALFKMYRKNAADMEKAAHLNALRKRER